MTPRSRHVFHSISAAHEGPFHVGKTRLFVLRQRGTPYVVADHCRHRGGPLSLGSRDASGAITCPWHRIATCADKLARDALAAVRVGDHITFALEARP